MALPTSLLQQIEQHACFSGTYDRETDATIVVDPSAPPQPFLSASCRDCLTFRVGALRSLLPQTLSAAGLADELTQHMRGLRGFSLSLGGYHATGSGFWLSMVYYDQCGLFLLDGSRSTRSRPGVDDLDLLIMAFQQGVLRPPHALMVDPQHFTTEVAYVNFTAPVPVHSKHDLQASLAYRKTAHAGFQRVTLAEFQPVARAAPISASSMSLLAPPAPVYSASASAAAVVTGVTADASGRCPGERCAQCGAEVRERPLFSGSFIGCLC